MERVCFLLHVKPDMVEEYRRQHAQVWPELSEVLTGAGWRNYSLFLSDDGLVVGYAECDDRARADEILLDSEVNSRWQLMMAPLFATTEGMPDIRGSLREVFHLP